MAHPDGKAVDVGPGRRVENLSQACEAIEVNAAGRVMPGFVDAHTHLAFPPPGIPDEGERAVRALRAYSSQRLEFRTRAQLGATAPPGRSQDGLRVR
jgi:imidazolonepropionase-like amidohydrolase